MKRKIQNMKSKPHTPSAIMNTQNEHFSFHHFIIYNKFILFKLIFFHNMAIHD